MEVHRVGVFGQVVTIWLHAVGDAGSRVGLGMMQRTHAVWVGGHWVLTGGHWVAV